MSSFTQAMRIIDEFVEKYYPVLPTDEVRTIQPSQEHTLTDCSNLLQPRGHTRVPLLSSLGQKSCSTVHAPIQMPLFDNSAMDGYALCSSDTTTASPTNPLKFRVLGVIAAGDAPPTVSEAQKPGELTCWAIMTGAAFPLTVNTEGDALQSSGLTGLYDACVKLELVEPQYQSDTFTSEACTGVSVTIPTYITINAPVDRNANCRFAGEDIQVGDVLLSAGEIVRKEHVMVLASVGIRDVEVEWDGGKWTMQRQMTGKQQRRLRIGIINTGKEVVLNTKPEAEPTMPFVPAPANYDILPMDHMMKSGQQPISTSHPPANQTDSRNPVDLLTPPPSCTASRSTSLANTAMNRQHRPNLGTSQIWNSNGPYIHAALLTWGFDCSDIEVLSVSLAEGQDGDDPDAFQATVKSALSYKENDKQRPFDVLISTGGVSTGVHDYVPSSVLALGGDIGFHKLKMRPGGPMMFAHLAHVGTQGDLGDTQATRAAYFGLPGNPLAAAVCLRFIVAPALQKMRGVVGGSAAKKTTLRGSRGSQNQAGQQQDRAVLQKKPPQTRMYVPARLDTSSNTNIEEGKTSSVEALARGSNMTRALLNANAWVCFREGEGREKVYEGDEVEVYSLDL
ncbi:hypothetical protein QFC19_000791 [Naganishia cerealis]|uniref:Uncharacterized protein n=1 Tax=Naganishia cerealis TaxID=610337 RepID=A0ACC2WLQ4_9TREE|nr:hypothetical protein QFC19_000791 [Naganishia cerealis]